MQYFLNDRAIGPYSGKEYGKKGDPVYLISEHGIMAIVEANGERFPIKLEKLSKAEVEPHPEPEEQEAQPLRPNYIKPAGRGKKSVTNHSNTIQSLF